MKATGTRRANILRFPAFFAAIATAISLFLPLPCVAHGDLTARHGGIVGWAGEMGLELVLGPDRTSLHVDDHGEAVDMAGGSAVVHFGSGADRKTITLIPSGGSALSGPAVTAAQGEAIIVFLTVLDGRVFRGRLKGK